MWTGVWTCGHAGVRMGMQKRMTVKKKKKGKKKKKKRLTGVLSRRMGVWTCCRWACVDALAGGRAWMRLRVDVNGCKQKEKRKGERKEKEE